MKSVCRHEMPSSCHEQIDSVLTQSDHRTRVTESHQKHRIHKQTAIIEHWRRLKSISSADGLWYVASGNNEFGNWHSIYPLTRRTDAMLSTFWPPADCQAIIYRWLGSFQTASKLDGGDITVIGIPLAFFLSAKTPCRNRKLPYAQKCTIREISTSLIKSYHSVWTCSDSLKATEIIEIDNM
jgi:hypothetical protein